MTPQPGRLTPCTIIDRVETLVPNLIWFAMQGKTERTMRGCLLKPSENPRHDENHQPFTMVGWVSKTTTWRGPGFTAKISCYDRIYFRSWSETFTRTEAEAEQFLRHLAPWVATMLTTEVEA